MSNAAACIAVIVLPATAGVAAHDGVTSHTATATENHQLGSWTPRDGNLITTKAKCEARRAFIRDHYRIPNSYLRCDRVDPLPPCDGPTRWVVMIWKDARIVVDSDLAAPARSAC